MATRRRPPVIPEIAKAYVNDPRTQLARSALASAASTAPVAEGKYGIADGIARVLGGIGGGLAERKMMDQYAPYEQQVLEEADANRKLALLRGGGAPGATIAATTPAPAQAPPGVSDVQAQAATQLGAPPAAPIAPPAPVAAAPPASTGMIAPVSAPGGGLGRRPFGQPSARPAALSMAERAAQLTQQGAVITSGFRTEADNRRVDGVADSYHKRGTPDAPMAYDFKPPAGMSMANLEIRARRAYPGYDVINEGDHIHVEPSPAMGSTGNVPPPPAPPTSVDVAAADGQEAVPAAPAPYARPQRPEAIKAGRSKLLDAAYDIIANKNAFTYARGQELYSEGLSQQDKMNEAALEREQQFLSDEYDTERGIYADSISQGRQNTFAERAAAQTRNFERGENAVERGFRAGESAKDRQQRTWETRFSASTQQALEGSRQTFEQAENARGHGYRMEELAVPRRTERANNADAFLNTAAGQKWYAEQQKQVGNANAMIATLDAFGERMGKTKTGGLVLSNAPGVLKWVNADLQFLDSLTNQLALAKADAMKGALSDKDVAFLTAIVPSIRNTRRANADQIKQLRGLAVRQRMFAQETLKAAQRGEKVEFLEDWSNYADNVEAASGVTFDQWRRSAMAAEYDRDGKRVTRK